MVPLRHSSPRACVLRPVLATALDGQRVWPMLGMDFGAWPDKSTHRCPNTDQCAAQQHSAMQLAAYKYRVITECASIEQDRHPRLVQHLLRGPLTACDTRCQRLPVVATAHYTW